MEHRANMKEVCNQIAEIKRVIMETKKRLTKEELQDIQTYRQSMIQRIQAVNEKHLEKEGIYVPRLRFTSDVFKKCNEISNEFEHDAKGRFIFP
jgi:sialic acid synthase SpsE